MIDATGYNAECGNRNLQLLFHDVEYSSVIHSHVLRDAILLQNDVIPFLTRDIRNSMMRQCSRSYLKS
jgi:hypothetical protein